MVSVCELCVRKRQLQELFGQIQILTANYYTTI